jgi:succinate-semialdehyde dehydrogenase/glutarate-semialdehyde dehydrogenase
LALETGKPYLAEAVREFDSVAYKFESVCEVAMHHYGTVDAVGIKPGYDEDISSPFMSR